MFLDKIQGERKIMEEKKITKDYIRCPHCSCVYEATEDKCPQCKSETIISESQLEEVVFNLND